MDLPSPALIIDLPVVRRNIRRMADYAHAHHLRLRPHTKTHKMAGLGALQIEAGAVGLTVAKIGEAGVMAQVADDIFLAYPPIGGREQRAAELGLRVGVDSREAVEILRDAGIELGVLVELDSGFHRTGADVAEAIAVACEIDRAPSLRFDGIYVYPGHLYRPGAALIAALGEMRALLQETLAGLNARGLSAEIVSGGSTPTAFQSHLVPELTEIRPGTYVFNDRNLLANGCCALEDCAALVQCTVISAPAAGKLVLDAGSKTLSSDRLLGDAEGGGHGFLPEYPGAKITRLSEEHAEVELGAEDRRPRVGERLRVLPNHICPCVNLQRNVWLREGDEFERVPVDAAGLTF